jgi:hypothetical protein
MLRRECGWAVAGLYLYWVVSDVCAVSSKAWLVCLLICSCSHASAVACTSRLVPCSSVLRHAAARCRLAAFAAACQQVLHTLCHSEDILQRMWPMHTQQANKLHYHCTCHQLVLQRYAGWVLLWLAGHETAGMMACTRSFLCKFCASYGACLAMMVLVLTACWRTDMQNGIGYIDCCTLQCGGLGTLSPHVVCQPFSRVAAPAAAQTCSRWHCLHHVSG